ncbi:DUF2497 domain-containing protein [Aurantimonas sp. E1-2-R+4]|uniref:PopZ family protein n=1 Tax=Aurantimonas sp. E1-2-R+4 TaxID=3113714 RepID=UPI002F9513DB
MSNALSAREPSMDEILASIRRIIESGDETVIATQAPDLEPLHGEPANAAGKAAELAADAVVWRAETPSESDGASVASGAIGDETAKPPSAGTATPAADGTTAPGRPRLGIVPPVKPVDSMFAEQPGEAGAEQSTAGLKVDPVAEMGSLPDRQTAEVMQGEDGLVESGEDSSLSTARLRAVSLASVSERRIEAVRAGAVPSEASEPIEEGDDDYLGALSNAIDAEGDEGETVDPLPDGDQTIGLDDDEDAVGEFDEEGFASELIENASQIAAESQVEGQSGAVEVATASSPAAATTEAAALDLPAGSKEASSASGPSLHGNAASAPIHELISQETGSRVAASFDNLARVIREEHLDSIDETVGEILRPMLQEWLDDNLPSLVEKLVREEIERVARGGRR